MKKEEKQEDEKDGEEEGEKIEVVSSLRVLDARFKQQRTKRQKEEIERARKKIQRFMLWKLQPEKSVARAMEKMREEKRKQCEICEE